jgi:hypothetical protein
MTLKTMAGITSGRWKKFIVHVKSRMDVTVTLCKTIHTIINKFRQIGPYVNKKENQIKMLSVHRRELG